MASSGSESTIHAGSIARELSTMSAIFCSSPGRLPASLRKNASRPSVAAVTAVATSTASTPTAASFARAWLMRTIFSRGARMCVSA